ncbi:MAG: cell wall-binding repeat-containing protein [Firmicutes bacterium]|nr:cell wall-binding repeat-containing protein [Bacillota bacterium]
MKKFANLRKVISLVLTLIMVLTAAVMMPITHEEAWAGSQPLTRVYGQSAYDTSREAIEEYLRINGKTKLEGVILTTGKRFQDAISGTYLSAVTDSPMFLINPDKYQEGIDYIAGKLNKDSVIYILGGEQALSPNIDEILKVYGFGNITRLAGETSIDTNLLVLEEADKCAISKGMLSGDILVSTAFNYRDALSAGSAGKPIMLTGAKLTEDQMAFLQARDTKQIGILGGTSAVKPEVETQSKTIAAVTRVGGSTAYDTSVQIAEKFFGNKAKEVVLVYGENFPDGLSGCAIAWSKKAPILLSSNDSPAQAYNYIKKYKIETATVLGGPKLVGNNLIPVKGGGLKVGWNSIGGKYVYVEKTGTIATGSFKDGQITIKPTGGGLVTPEQKNGFIWPVEGPLTSFFGYRPAWATNYIGSTNHGGIDIGVGYYTKVKAARDGKVVQLTGWVAGYGNTVTIQHDDGFVTLYAHNSSIKVKVGQRVKQGDVIALSGSTGNSTGPHVHFEIRKNGVKVDPLKYLPANKYYKK